MNSIGCLRRPDQIFNRPLKPLPKRRRQHSSCLRYVDLECRIQRGIEVDRRAGEFYVLVKRPHPAPSTTLNHAVCTVDVKALLRVPLSGTRVALECFLAGKALTR